MSSSQNIPMQPLGSPVLVPSIAGVPARLNARTGDVEAQVFLCWTHHDAPPGLALFAVGGFGRRELFPHSDVDLLIVTEGAEPTTEQREHIGRFVQMLWDRGLRVSQSVHSVKSCCRLDQGNVEFSISLLDRRFLTGDTGLAQELQTQFAGLLQKSGSVLLQHLIEHTRERHAEYDGTIYHLEPNLKDGCGGMRDAHVVRWLGQLGSASELPYRAMMQIAALRLALHQLANRDHNQLRFDDQHALFASADAGMREYFRAARELFQVTTRQLEWNDKPRRTLLLQVEDWQARLSNSDFTVSRQRVLLRNPKQLSFSLLKGLLYFVGKHGIPPAADTLRRLDSWNAYVSQNDWSLWHGILDQPHATLALRTLDEVGLLGQWLPEWQRIDCLVVPDFFHRYTVDEHTLRTIATFDSLRARTPADGAVGDGRFREIAAEVGRPDLLRFALLLHDLGKGQGGDHTQIGADVAENICLRLGVPDAERQLVIQLVRKHLLLSDFVTRRDITDDEAAQQLAGEVGTLEFLKLLTVLTFCDINGVNPTALTTWRRDQLWRAYVAVSKLITRNVPEERLPEGSGLTAGFPRRYRQTHTSAEITADEVLLAEAMNAGTACSIAPSEGGVVVTVACPDRHGLFADLAGAVSAFGLNTIRAEAYSGSSHYVLDRFYVEDPFRSLELNPSEVARLSEQMRQAAAGLLDVASLLRSRKARTWPGRERFRSSVTVEHGLHHSIFEVTAVDRPGLLYELAHTFAEHACELDVVLVDTQSYRALDVFYVTQKDGPVPEAVATRLRDLLREIIA